MMFIGLLALAAQVFQWAWAQVSGTTHRSPFMRRHLWCTGLPHPSMWRPLSTISPRQGLSISLRRSTMCLQGREATTNMNGVTDMVGVMGTGMDTGAEVRSYRPVVSLMQA